MVDYERVKEVVAFDEQGYMASSIEFLEGDQSMNMPEEIYKSLKEYMPAKDVNHDPIIKQEMSNGVIKFGVSLAISYTRIPTTPKNIKLIQQRWTLYKPILMHRIQRISLTLV